jgi:signal transduction histidine kinase
MDIRAGTLSHASRARASPIQQLFARFVTLHEHGPRGIWYLGVMGLVMSPLYYLLRFTKTIPGYDDWWLRVLHMVVGAAICLRVKWPEKWKPYFYHFTYFALIFTCPFTFVFKSLQDGGGPVSVANTMLAIFFVVMLSDWRNMIVIMIIGVAAATGLYVLTAPAPTMPVDYVQRLPVYVALMLGGALFKRAFETATIERTRALERQVSESRVSTLQESIGFLGHELNTPLATVRLTVGAVISNVQPGKSGQRQGHVAHFREEAPGDTMRLLEAAEAQALYCQAIVDQVMKSAFHLRPSPPSSEFSAAELVKALTDAYPFTAVERRWLDVTIRRDFRMRGSRDLFFLVLSTLTKNALNALRGRDDPRLVFEVDGDSDQEDVGRIRVVDTGVGITKSQLQTLSTCLTRPKAAGGDGGAWMGLMFCARVMEACNGSLSIESEFGRGTTVTLQFTPTWIQV